MCVFSERLKVGDGLGEGGRERCRTDLCCETLTFAGDASVCGDVLTRQNRIMCVLGCVGQGEVAVCVTECVPY